MTFKIVAVVSESPWIIQSATKVNKHFKMVWAFKPRFDGFKFWSKPSFYNLVRTLIKYSLLTVISKCILSFGTNCITDILAKQSWPRKVTLFISHCGSSSQITLFTAHLHILLVATSVNRWLKQGVLQGCPLWPTLLPNFLSASIPVEVNVISPVFKQ